MAMRRTLSVDKLTRPFNRHAGQVTTRALRPRIPLRRPMKPPLDLAYRARNWFWYWRVREASGLSNERLDVACFGDSVRRRSFDRIQKTASSPDDVPVVSGKTLLETVSQWPPGSDEPSEIYKQVISAFRSNLWGLLARQPTDVEGYRVHLSSFAARHGWERIQGPNEAAFLEGPWNSSWLWRKMRSAEFAEMLLDLGTEASPDALAALLALYLEAAEEGDGDHQPAIRMAITSVLMRFESHLGVDRRTTSLLRRLIEDRVTGRRWIEHFGHTEIRSPEATSSKNSAARARKFNDYVDWYVNQPAHLGSDAHSKPCRCHGHGVTLWVKVGSAFIGSDGQGDSGSRSPIAARIYRHATLRQIALALAEQAGAIQDMDRVA